MGNMRKKYTADEKAKIALEALSGRFTQAELSSKYGVHNTQISTWKKLLKSNISDVFKDKRKRDSESQQALVDELYRQIGQLKVELDWLKKKSELFD